MQTSLKPLLAYTDDDIELRSACRHVIDNEMPVARLRQHLDTEGGWDRDLWPQIVELGWPGVAVPEQLGGVGMGFGALNILAEELGRSVGATPLLDHALGAFLLARLDQTDLMVPRVASLCGGDHIAAVTLDVDGSAGRLTVQRRGDRLTLSGSRAFVAHALDASMLIADVTLDGELSLAVIDLAAVPHATRPMITIDIARPRFVLSFDNVDLEPSAIITDAGSPREFAIAAAIAVQCAESVGAARWLMESAVEYSKQRRQFDQLIGSFQAIKHRVADMRIRLEASVVATRYASSAVERQASDCHDAASVAAQWVGGATSWIASETLQVLGGVGFTWEHDMHLYMRRLKANELILGSPDFHSREIGRRCLADATSHGSGVRLTSPDFKNRS